MMLPRLLSLLMVCVVFSTPLAAQITPSTTTATSDTDTRYLAGACPVVNSYVTLTREVTTAAAVDTTTLRQWLVRCMQDSRVGHHVDVPAKGAPLRLAEALTLRLTFSRSLLSHDYADLTAVLTLIPEADKVTLRLDHITFLYPSGDRKDRLKGEDMISDDVALSRKGAIIRGFKKFRVSTIDLMDELATSLTQYLSQQPQ